MRSDRPMPGNPWPRDMTMTVEDRPTTLLELLWLREAHGLVPEGDDLPPLLRETPAPAASPVGADARAEWEGAWGRVWSQALAHAGRDSDSQLFYRIRETADGSPERGRLLREIEGPNGREEFGSEAFDDRSYREWEKHGMDVFIRSRRAVLENSPEHRDLDALVRAWRAGLTKIVTIPCIGEYTRRIGANVLLVTDGTRADSEQYPRALNSFATLA